MSRPLTIKLSTVSGRPGGNQGSSRNRLAEVLRLLGEAGLTLPETTTEQNFLETLHVGLSALAGWKAFKALEGGTPAGDDDHQEPPGRRGAVWSDEHQEKADAASSAMLSGLSAGERKEIRQRAAAVSGQYARPRISAPVADDIAKRAAAVSQRRI